MQVRIFLLFSTLITFSTLPAQSIMGVWEGSFSLSKNRKMNIRIEVLQAGKDTYGMIYTRSSYKGSVFGCDYIVGVTRSKDMVEFSWPKVMRATGMNTGDCGFFRMYLGRLIVEDSARKIKGNWVWGDGSMVPATIRQVDTVASFSANDDVTEHLNRINEQFEKSNTYLLPHARINGKMIEIEVDSSDIVLEISTIDSSVHDSVSVYLDGEAVSEFAHVQTKPLRIRFQKMKQGEYDVHIVNQSIAQPLLYLRLRLLHQGQVKDFNIYPSFTRNSFIRFKNKQE